MWFRAAAIALRKRMHSYEKVSSIVRTRMDERAATSLSRQISPLLKNSLAENYHWHYTQIVLQCKA